MKTNHRRSFKEPGSFRDRSCQTIAQSRVSGKSVGIGNDFTNGHRGHAKAVRGAKKFVRTRDRIANKQVARKALVEIQTGE